MFWIKLKTSLSLRQIESLFNVPGDSENQHKRAADAFDSIRLCLVEHFVPRHLGVGHLSRDEATKQNMSFSTEFFDHNVTIIWDGTYIYVGKSSSHSINRNTYSGHKQHCIINSLSSICILYTLETVTWRNLCHSCCQTVIFLIQ